MMSAILPRIIHELQAGRIIQSLGLLLEVRHLKRSLTGLVLSGLYEQNDQQMKEVTITVFQT